MERRDGAAQLPDEMTQPATIDAVPTLVEFVSAHLWEGGYEEERRRDICLAMEEALQNAINFACCEGPAEITIRCVYDNTETFCVVVIDTGKPFNPLIAGAFPETADFVGPGQAISLKKIKKAIKIIEYRRDGDLNKNILACWLPK